MGGRSTSSGMGGRSGGGSRFNDTNNIRAFLQGQLGQYGLGISKNNLAEQVYRAAESNGMNVAILNGKYLTVSNDNGSAEFSFTKSSAEGKWKLTPMLGYGDVTKGRHNGYTMYRANGQWYSNKADAEWAAIRKMLG